MSLVSNKHGANLPKHDRTFSNNESVFFNQLNFHDFTEERKNSFINQSNLSISNALKHQTSLHQTKEVNNYPEVSEEEQQADLELEQVVK